MHVMSMNAALAWMGDNKGSRPQRPAKLKALRVIREETVDEVTSTTATVNKNSVSSKHSSTLARQPRVAENAARTSVVVNRPGRLLSRSSFAQYRTFKMLNLPAVSSHKIAQTHLSFRNMPSSPSKRISISTSVPSAAHKPFFGVSVASRATVTDSDAMSAVHQQCSGTQHISEFSADVKRPTVDAHEVILIDEMSEFAIDDSSQCNPNDAQHPVLTTIASKNITAKQTANDAATRQSVALKRGLDFDSVSSDLPTTRTKSRSSSTNASSTPFLSPSPAIVMPFPAHAHQNKRQRCRSFHSGAAYDVGRLEIFPTRKTAGSSRVNSQDQAELTEIHALLDSTSCIDNVFCSSPPEIIVSVPPPQPVLSPAVQVPENSIFSKLAISTHGSIRLRQPSLVDYAKRTLPGNSVIYAVDEAEFLAAGTTSTNNNLLRMLISSCCSSKPVVLNNCDTVVEQLLFKLLYTDVGPSTDGADSGGRYCADPMLLLPITNEVEQERYNKIFSTIHRSSLLNTYSLADCEPLGTLRRRVLMHPVRYEDMSAGAAPQPGRDIGKILRKQTALWDEASARTGRLDRSIQSCYCAVITGIRMSQHHYQGAGEGYCTYKLEFTDPSLISTRSVAGETNVDASLLPPPSMQLSYFSNIRNGQGANNDKLYCPFELFDVVWFYNVEPVIAVMPTNDGHPNVVLTGGDASRCNTSPWQWARFPRAKWESARRYAVLAAIAEAEAVAGTQPVEVINARVKMPPIKSADLQMSPRFARRILFDEHCCGEKGLSLVEMLHAWFNSEMMRKCVPPVVDDADDSATAPALLFITQHDGNARAAAQSLCLQAKLFEEGRFLEAQTEAERYAESKMPPPSVVPMEESMMLGDQESIPVGADAAAWVASQNFTVQSNDGTADESKVVPDKPLQVTVRAVSPLSQSGCSSYFTAKSNDIPSPSAVVLRFQRQETQVATRHLLSPLSSSSVYYDAQSQDGKDDYVEQ